MEPKEIIFDLVDMVKMDLDSAPSLDIPVLETVAFYMPPDRSDYMLFLCQLDEDYRPDCGCPECGKDVELKSDGLASDMRLVHDVIRNNCRVDILFFPKRWKCSVCGKRIPSPKIPGIYYDRQRTDRLDEYLKKECLLRPFTELQELTGYSANEIGEIADEEADRLNAEWEKIPIEAPTVLGIDEKHTADSKSNSPRKRKKPRGVLVDGENRRLLDILEDNKKETMQKGIERLRNWQNNIKVVTMDMSPAYLSWVPEFLPNATVVIDHFHVMRDVEQCVSESRKVLYRRRKEIIGAVDDLEERARQMAVLRILNKNKYLTSYSMARLTREKDGKKLKKLATVLDTFPEYRLLHNLRYGAEHLYECMNREDAEKAWEEWYETMPPRGDREYETWCERYDVDPECFTNWRSFNQKAFLQFKPYILNYFNPGCRKTNGPTEGLNSLIAAINLSGKGYSFKIMRAKCLFASLINKRTVYGFNKKSVRKADFSVINNQGLFSSINLFGSGGSTHYREVPVYEFTEREVDVNLPELTVDGDVSWLLPMFDDTLYEDKVAMYRQLHGKEDEQIGRYKEPEAPPPIYWIGITNEQFKEELQRYNGYDECPY